MKILPDRYRFLDEALPPMNGEFFVADGRVLKPMGRIKARVAMLGGCAMSMMHAATLDATVRVLVHNGFEVHLPASQGCCGSMNLYAGERTSGLEMASNNAEALLSVEPDVVVSASAGCGSTMKEYGEMLPDDRRRRRSWPTRLEISTNCWTITVLRRLRAVWIRKLYCRIRATCCRLSGSAKRRGRYCVAFRA